MDTKKASVKEKDDSETHNWSLCVTVIGTMSTLSCPIATAATFRVQGIMIKLVDMHSPFVNPAKPDAIFVVFLLQGIVLAVTLLMIYGNLEGNAGLMTPYLWMKNQSLSALLTFIFVFIKEVIYAGQFGVAFDFVLSTLPQTVIETALLPYVERRIDELVKAKQPKTGFTPGDDNNPINAASTVGGIPR